jgi:hypothetical protein
VRPSTDVSIILLGAAALLVPPIEFALFPASEPTARDDPVVRLLVGRSTAVPVLVTPGWVTPVPAEFGCGALGFAPVCANATPEILAVSKAAIAIGVLMSLPLQRLPQSKTWSFLECSSSGSCLPRLSWNKGPRLWLFSVSIWSGTMTQDDTSKEQSAPQQGVVRDERGQEQPADKERAQHVSRKNKGDDPPGQK